MPKHMVMFTFNQSREKISRSYTERSILSTKDFFIAFLLTFMIVTGMFLPPSLSGINSSEGGNDGQQRKDEGSIATIHPLASNGNKFIGAYIRGSRNASESNITIQGQLVADNGTPINDSELEVSIWQNDSKWADVGKWYTNDSGYFNITFNYTAERMADIVDPKRGLPISNVTVNVTAPPQPPNFGGTTELYTASIYARVLNELRLNTKEIPTFENNSSLIGVNRLKFDNTSLVQKDLVVNITLLNENGSQVNNTNMTNSMTVKGEKDFNLSVGNLPNGTYSLRSSLWLNLYTNNETLNNSWILGEESYLVNNDSAGLMLSNTSASFTVLNASKIEFSSIQPDIANRSGEVIELTGRHLNSEGEGTNKFMTLEINHTTSNATHTYNSTSEHCSINDSTGAFSWNITVNSSFQVGTYRIRADDDISTHCVSDELSLTVKSQLNLTDVTIPSERVRIGELFNISGRVVDTVDNSNVTATIEVLFTTNEGQDNDTSFYHLENEKSFTIETNITTNVTISNVTVTANAPFYWADRFQGNISIYNYTVASVFLSKNQTYDRTYRWHRRNNTTFNVSNNTTFNVSSKTNVTAAITFTDNFDRSFRGNISLLFQNTTGDLIQNTTLSYPSNSSAPLTINENGTLRIVFPSFNVSISIRIIPSPTNPEESVSLPFPILLGIGVLLSMGGIGLVSFVVFGRSKAKVKERTLESVLREMNDKISEGNKLELLNLSLEALKLVGKHFDIHWKENWTPREFFLMLIKSKKTFSYEEILKDIYTNYEEVLFAGEENWKKKMRLVHDNLVQLNKKMKGEENA